MEQMQEAPAKRRGLDWFLFTLLSLVLVGGFVFSIISSLGLCDAECNQTKFYRFFGQPFAMVGLLFFGSAFLLHWLSLSYQLPHALLGYMLAGAGGAEIYFLAIQKFEIGHWCPLCVTIAGTVGLALLLYGAERQCHRKRFTTLTIRESSMKSFVQSSLFVLFAAVGLFLAFTGISKPNYTLRAVDEMQQKVALGNTKSPLEVYLVSDWFCPSCRKIEPEIERLYPMIKEKASLYFIDYAIHPETLNYSPYNLAFLLEDKESYLKARHMLFELSRTVKSPTEALISQKAKKERLAFSPLPFPEVRAGIDFFEKIAEKYKIQGTPTMILVNKKTGKTKQLEGSGQITQTNVIKELNALMSRP